MKRLFNIMLLAGLLLAFNTEARRTDDRPLITEQTLSVQEIQSIDQQIQYFNQVEFITLGIKKDDNCGGACTPWYLTGVLSRVERYCVYPPFTVIYQQKDCMYCADPRCPFSPS